MAEIQISIAGYLMIALALLHILFPRYFKWKEELADLSLVNRQMIYIHTLFIGIILLLMGLLCIAMPHELIATKLGTRIAAGFGCFWAVRLIVQFAGYAPELWSGKMFETVVHICFSLLWIYLTIVFFYVFWIGKA